MSLTNARPHLLVTASICAALLSGCGEDGGRPFSVQDTGGEDSGNTIDSTNGDTGHNEDSALEDTDAEEDSAIEDTGSPDTGTGDTGTGDTGTGDTDTGDTGTDSGTPSTGIAAYVWANNATSASYATPAAFSYNSSGGAINITRSLAGTYAVAFTGLDLNSANVQVTSYGSDAFCAVSSWNASTGTVNVNCLAPSGSPTVSDSRFMLAVTKKNVVTNAQVVAYASANQPTATGYAPEGGGRSYQPGSGTITASRYGTGVYSIAFGGLANVNSGNVQVTATGSDATACSVWGTSTSTARIDVRCFKRENTEAGVVATPVDTTYSISIIQNGVASDAKVFGYALTNDSTSGYTPDPVYSFNRSGGAVGVLYGGGSTVGKYSVSFAAHSGVGSAGNIKVTKFGGAGYCKPVTWGEDTLWGTGDYYVDVQCYDWAGAPANGRFMVSWMK